VQSMNCILLYMMIIIFRSATISEVSIALPSFVYLTRKGGDIVFLVDGDVSCLLHFCL